MPRCCLCPGLYGSSSAHWQPCKVRIRTFINHDADHTPLILTKSCDYHRHAQFHDQNAAGRCQKDNSICGLTMPLGMPSSAQSTSGSAVLMTFTGQTSSFPPTSFCCMASKIGSIRNNIVKRWDKGIRISNDRLIRHVKTRDL